MLTISMLIRGSIIIAVVAVLHGCAASRQDEIGSAIGYAELASDGTIALNLSLPGHDGGVVHMLKIYHPADVHYQEVKDHVGELAVGEKKRVLPWPDHEKREKRHGDY